MSDRSSVAFANLAAARALVDSLVVAGLRHAVVCPGSRSGPLAVALDEREEEVRTFILTDERSAGFFALGLARESGKPTLVVCTSGTAAANLLPAAAEAFFSEVPLVLATADRPPEARDFGAAQTIHQVGLFAAHTRASMDLAPPSAELPPLAYYRASAARAFSTAMAAPPGPVHMNVPFREPLLPVPLPAIPREASRLRCVQGVTTLANADVDGIVERLRRATRGLLVCGPSSRAPETAPAIADLARVLGWPILADPLSGLRSDDFADLAVADTHDTMLRSAEFRRAAHADVVLRFGGVPTSRALQQALAEWRCPQLLVATPGTWPDPAWSATDIVSCDPAAAALALAARLRTRASGADSRWSPLWSKSSSTVRSALDVMLDRLPAAFEGRIARDLARRVPEQGLFFVGNSTPIRDVDTFSARVPRGARVLGNRGANGIDGVLSTALGAAAGSARPTVLLLGDLSFLHDVGALQVAARLGAPLLVVVVNNDGGGIFHTLPAAALGETFERCFATPHGLDLSASAPAGAAGSCEIRRAATGAELEGLLDAWLAAPRPLVLEVPSDRREAAATRSAIISDAVAALERSGELAA